MKVYIVAAITADGFIARDSHEFPGWTSKEDKKSFRNLTKDAVLIFGGNTLRAIGRTLPSRRNIVYTRHTLDIEGAETTQLPPEQLIKQLENEGHNEVAICGGSTIYSMFLDAGVVDEIYLTVEPLLFGSGVSLLSSQTEAAMELLEQTMLNEHSILLHYKIVKG